MAKKYRRRKRQVEFEEYSLEGLDYTSEAWRRTLDPDRRLLTFAGLHSVFTREQAVRYLCGFDTESLQKARQANELLNRRTGQQQWFCHINFSFAGPTPASLEVYYLTQHAVVELRKLAPVLARYASPGKPTGVNFERIPHEVDVVEAHLHALAAGHVHKFLNEKDLKSRIRKKRHERISQGEMEAVSESTGDFELWFQAKNKDKVARIVCEVATHNMKPDQIRSKPDGMIWFTRNLHRRDVIAEIKGSKTHIMLLTDPVACHVKLAQLLLGVAPKSPAVDQKPLNFADTPHGNSNLKPREKRVMNALSQLGGAATTEAIAAFLGVQRSGISRCLNELERKKVVHAEGACLCAERDLGAPTLLYLATGYTAMDENMRRHRLIVSLMFTEFSYASFRFCSFNASTGALEMRHGADPQQPRQVVVADNHEVSVDVLRVRILRARGSINAPKTVVVAMSDEARMQRLRGMNAPAKIVDVSRNSRSKAA